MTRRSRRSSANRRTIYLLRRYELSEDDFTLIVVYQDGRCPLCRRLLDLVNTRVAIDHDHSVTNKRESVRGILHMRCNGLLGYIEKYPWLVSDFVRSYLDKPPAKEALK